MSAVSESVANDKRLQKRFEVLQAASLRTASGRELACEIHDFCLGGLFLKFAGAQNDSATASDMNEGDGVEISFTPPSAISTQTFNLKARLARRGPDGVGVAFIGSPIEATRTLNKVAASLRTQRMVQKRYKGMDRKPLQATCQTLLEETLAQAISEFYGLIQDKLSATAAQSTSFSERNDLMGAFDKIKMHETLAQQGIRQGVMTALEQLFKLGKKPEPQREEAGLSIVQTDEFENWLNLMAEVNKLEYRFSVDLAALEPRLEKLYGRAIDRSTNPFAPSVVEHAVQDVFESLNLTLKARQVIYATMGEALIRPLGDLYEKLSTMLPEDDGSRQPASTQQTNDGWPDSQGGGMSEDMIPDPSMFSDDPSTGGREKRSADQAGTAASSAGGVASALMNLFRRARRPNQPGHAPGAGPMAAGHQAGQQGSLPDIGAGEPQGGVVDTGMSMAVNYGPSLSVTSNRVLNELFAGGRVQSGQREAAQGSAEVFNALSKTIDAEQSLPSSVKSVVKQLEEPLLKLAVLDSRFLNSQQHPAHRVLNAVDRLAMVSSDDGHIYDKKLLAVIQRWSERIKKEADTNPGIYEEARNQLEKVLQPLMRFRNIRIARLQAGLEGWQKMGQANRAITKEIERRIAGQEVPDVVIEFFNPGWRNYLIRVLLRHGAGSPEETEAWQAVDHLLEWMNPELTERPPFSEVQHLLSYIDARLTMVSAGKDVQENIMERLADGLIYPDRCHFKRVPEAKAITKEQEADQVLGEQDAALIGQFRVGDWLSFADAPTPLNLIWTGDDPHVFVFSNFKGIRKLELKRADFLTLIKSGGAKRTDNLDLPMMDRSFSSMIEHMHHDLLTQATSDPETELMGRPEFMRRAKRAWMQVEGDEAGCILGVIDIEDLRMVQMRISPEGYQKMIHALALHLNQKCTAGGFIARTGDRTFAFMRSCQNQESAQAMAESFITHINQFNFEWADEAFTLTANAGLAWANAFIEPETLYNKADTACLSAKHEGRNQLVFFHDEDSAHTGHAGLAYWASRFNSILSSDRLYLRCQPIVSLAEDAEQTSHYEILLGASTDENEPIQIGDFVAAIERLKRISELDQWVVRAVFGWIRSHPKEFEKVGAFSVNLSGPSVNSKSFFSFMEEELGRGDIPGHKLIFEITESAAIDSFVNAEQFIKKFRRYGCRFSLDDFGVGFSSFTYLKNLKVDYLKIDGSFVRDMVRNEVDVALVSSMHETSRFLGIKTIAESVENEETLDQLKAIGVNYVQGFHTGKPMHIDQLAA